MRKLRLQHSPPRPPPAAAVPKPAGAAGAATPKAVTAPVPKKPSKPLSEQVSDAEREYERLKQDFEAMQKEGVSRISNDPSIAALQTLMQNTKEAYQKNVNPDFGDLESTVNLLDMLSDKKASFTGGKQPGSYRYFSASHPKQDGQGQQFVTYTNTPDAKGSRRRTEPATLDTDRQGQKVLGFSASPKAPYPGAPFPEAALEMVSPMWGIRVLTGNKHKPQGEVLPTNEILELMFSVQAAQPQTTRHGHPNEVVLSLGKTALDKYLQGQFSLDSGLSFDPSSSIADLFKSVVDGINATVMAAVKKVEADAGKRGKSTKSFPQFPVIQIPASVSLTLGKKDTVDTSFPLSQYKLADTAGSKALAFPATLRIEDLVAAIGVEIAADVSKQIQKGHASWLKDIAKLKLKGQGGLLSASVLIQYLTQTWGIAALAQPRTQVKGQGKVGNYLIESPVFPVSDAAGYEVMGTWRYGRGVGIEPNGVFDVLHHQDPLAMLDAKTRHDVSLYVNSHPEEIQQIRNQLIADKQKKPGSNAPLEPVKPSAGFANLNSTVLAGLRTGLTDQNIIDLGAARRNTSSSNMLDFDFRNFIAGNGADGIQKIPINNAAFTLADLGTQNSKKACSCKVAEADMLLDLLDNQEFLGVDMPDADPVSKSAAGSMLAMQARWQQSQDALRGGTPDRGSSFMSDLNGVSAQFKAASPDAHQTVATIRADAATLGKKG